MKDSITIRYVLFVALVVTGSWVLHEFAHWLMGESLGYDMKMTLNKGYPLAGKYKSAIDYQWISAAGPLITIIEAIVVFVLLRRMRSIYLFAILLTCFYMRLLALGLSFSKPNDEARISDFLGWGAFTLPLIVNLFLFSLVYLIAKRHRFSAGFIALTFAFIILFSSMIILSDQYFQVRLL
jgi:hypothetical protein